MGFTSSVVACIWDFDKTLIPGYMQSPMFRDYGIDEPSFWKAVNSLPQKFAQKGIRLSDSFAYLNFLLSAVKGGHLPGLTREKLFSYGKQLKFFPGIPNFFSETKREVRENEIFAQYDIELEHYIISSGHAETIRGSDVAEHVDGIFACEFLGNEINQEVDAYFPGSLRHEVPLGSNCDNVGRKEIFQIASIVDNTQKTRCIFEINKGCNKNTSIDVNASINLSVRRIPFDNMIYVADGPSDIPAFSVVKANGGKTFAVYNPDEPKEFEQNDMMLQEGRIDAYGPADYRNESTTAKWLKMHIQRICHRIVENKERQTAQLVGKPPAHLH